MTFLLGIIPFLLLISLIVTIHELGHFSVARLFKTKIERFSVGFGPILLSRRDKNGVLWCLSALPLGGYVKFSGDEHVSSMSPDAKELEAAKLAITQKEGAGAELAYFHFKPVWQRFLIVAAGPVANFILAIVLFAGILMFTGEGYYPADVSRVMPDSPAAAAGFKSGDRIIAVDGRAVEARNDAQRLIMLRAESETIVTVERDGGPVDLKVRPERVILNPGSKEAPQYGGRIGLEFDGNSKVITRKYWPHEAVMAGANMTWQVLDTNLTYIGRIFIGKEDGKELSGIIGMTKVAGDLTAESAKVQGNAADKAGGWIFYMLQMAAVISVGIGFVNLLPVPVLDGGHLVFYTYEAIARKPLDSAIQGLGYRFGLMALLGLMLFATWNDLNRVGVIKFFGGLFS